MYALARGNLQTGYTLIGPFNTEAEAVEWYTTTPECELKLPLELLPITHNGNNGQLVVIQGDILTGYKLYGFYETEEQIRHTPRAPLHWMRGGAIVELSKPEESKIRLSEL